MAAMFEHVVEIVGTDRATVVERGDLLVAHGAGDGAAAVVEAILSATTDDWSSVFLTVEDELAKLPASASAVAVSFGGDNLSGVAAGDSRVWWIDDDGIIDFTEKQLKQPLVGRGCSPYAFRIRGIERGTLLVASATLFEHAKPEQIEKLVRGQPLQTAIRELTELAARVAIVLVRA
jgi:hypothetical protein